MSYTYEYPRPALTVDTIIIAQKGSERMVLLIERLNEPFKNRWAFPGGFVDVDEDLLVAAYRELEEETGLKGIELKQLGAFGEPHRDPRGHTVSIIFWAAVNGTPTIVAGDDASKAQWFSLTSLPPLAFDHDKILAALIKEFDSN